MYEKVYKDNKYNYEKLRKLLHDFNKLLEEYISFMEFEKEGAHRELLLLKFFRERKIKRAFTRHLTSVNSKQPSPFEKNIEYYKNRIFIGYEEDVFNLDKSFSSSKTVLKTLEENINNYFVITKLDLFKSMKSDSYLVNKKVEYPMWMEENILDYVEKNIIRIKKEHPFIYTEYLMYMLISKENADNFYYELKDFVTRHRRKISDTELEIIYSHLKNYCAMNTGREKNNLKGEMFEIIKTMERKSMLFNNNAHVDYINAVTLALELKQFSWTKKFIETNRERLEPEYKENAYNLACGKYFYAVKEYDKALRHLRHIGYMNFYYYFFINRLMLKIYYEKKEHEGMLFIIDAMKHFLLRKDTIPDYYKSSNKIFLKYFSKLIVCRSHEDALHIRNMLSAEKPFAERNWLLEKLGQAH